MIQSKDHMDELEHRAVNLLHDLLSLKEKDNCKLLRRAVILIETYIQTLKDIDVLAGFNPEGDNTNDSI